MTLDFMNILQKVVLEMKGPSTVSQSVQGKVHRVEGKQAFVQVQNGASTQSQIKAVYTIGKEEYTSAEQDRVSVILSILHCESSFFHNPVVRKILFPSPSDLAPRRQRRSEISIGTVNGRSLNPSQEEAVQSILSEHDYDYVGLIHGPP